MGALLNIAGGAGLKILSSFINGWLANKREKQVFTGKMDEKRLDYQMKIIMATNKDIYVKVSRSIIFIGLVGTYCFAVTWSIINPDFHYDLVFPKSKGIFAFLFGAQDQTKLTLDGGMMVWKFTELIEVIVGFFAIPSKRR